MHKESTFKAAQPSNFEPVWKLVFQWALKVGYERLSPFEKKKPKRDSF